MSNKDVIFVTRFGAAPPNRQKEAVGLVAYRRFSNE
jgi:hypothetical protein